jgi:hypothetical protein
MQISDIDEMNRVEKQRQFIRAMSRSIEGRPVTAPERTLLNAIFEALLRGEDVSDLIGIKPARIRRARGIKRVGHAGTLDPAASGLLVVGIGAGTRLLTFLVGLDKVVVFINKDD